MLLGVVLTLGTQLLLALLLRTLWAQRAIAALESWLQAVFGVSLRNGRSSYTVSSSMEEDGEADSELARTGSDSSSVNSSSSRSSSSSSTRSSSSNASTSKFGGKSKKGGRY